MHLGREQHPTRVLRPGRPELRGEKQQRGEAGFGGPLLWAVSSLAEGQSPFPACGIVGQPQVFALHRG